MREIVFSFYAYLTDFVKLWLVIWGIMNFPIIKKKKIFLSIGIILLMVLIVSGLFSPRYADIGTFIWTFTVIFSIGFMFEGRFFKKLGYSMLAYIFILFLDTCVIGITALYVDKSGLEVLSSMRMVYNTANILTIGTIVLITKRKKNSVIQFSLSRRVYALLFSGAATGFLTLAALLVRSNNEATENARRIMVIVTIIAVFSYMATCLMIVILTESRDKYRALSIINQNIIESQHRYYNLVNEKQQEMRSLRHEMKNHLACIYALYQADKGQEMEHYLEQIIETSEFTGDLFDTGNDIVNAVLNDAQSKCKKEHIMIRLSGEFPKELNILPMDLCVIFANIVSNAVEALQGMKREKGIFYFIDLSIKCFKDDLFIQIKNPISEDKDIDVKKLQTTKANKDMHGFGVKNIIERVEKYGGNVIFSCENNEFSVEIEMKNCL